MVNRRNVALLGVLAVAGIAIGVSLKIARPGHASTQVEDPPPASATTDIRPSPIAESVDIVIRPPRPAPQPASAAIPEANRARTAPVSNDNSKDWSVVAATLNSTEAAERRAQSLKAQWKDCSCTVFPKGESQHYYVVVGSGMNRDSADKLRDRATAAGLPGDTYVTKLIRRPGDSEP